MGKQWKTAGRELQAAKKGALFTRLSRAIQTAVRKGGSNVEDNPSLKVALDSARLHSLSKETIKRALKKGIGTECKGELEEVVYEGFGPHGVAVMVFCLTNNRKRTASEIRFLFKKHGGSMGAPGSAAWVFNKASDGSYHVKTALSIQKEQEQSIEDFLSAFEENPDCQKVVSNYTK